jgi:hypothetical protein
LKGIPQLRLSRTQAKESSVFDEANLVSAIGLIPVIGLAQKYAHGSLMDEHLRMPEYFGTNWA